MARNFRELEVKLEARLGPTKWAAHQARLRAAIAEVRAQQAMTGPDLTEKPETDEKAITHDN